MEEEKNNKFKKEKIKRKRKVSILTVFLWVALIAIMSVITISGIVKNNAFQDTKKITLRIDFSEYFENVGTIENNKIYYMRDNYLVYISKTNSLTNKSTEISNIKFIEKDGNVGIYECDVVSSDKYIMFHDVNEIYELYKYNVVSEGNETSYIKDNEDEKTYYGIELKENQDGYEVKLVRREDLRKVTVRIDFSEYFENEEVSNEKSFMSNYKVDISKTNNFYWNVLYEVKRSMNFVRSEENIGIYECEIPDDMKYIMYHNMIEKDGLYKYEIESKNGQLEAISYYTKSTVKDMIENKYYGEVLKEEQDEYEVKLVKRADVRNVTVKIDFSEYFEDKNITEESKKINNMGYYSIYLSKAIDEVSTSYGSLKMSYVGNEEDVGIYECEVTNELKYIIYHSASTNDKYNTYSRYKVASETNSIHFTSSYDDIFYGESLKEEQDVYEIKIVKKEGQRKITVKIDFSEYFESEGINAIAYGEYLKLQYMQKYAVSVSETKYAKYKRTDIKPMSYKGKEGDIGIYEYEITSDDKYIVYHEVVLFDNNLYKYDIESEGVIENINCKNTDTHVSDNYSYDFYGEKIKEDQDVYNVKLRKRTDARKITLKIDFSKYFENEEITEESTKTDFASKYAIYTSKTNDITKTSKDVLAINFVKLEGNIGIYEKYITNDFLYVMYHNVYDTNKNMNKYKIENNKNDIDYKENNENYTLFYGENIKDNQDIYEVRLNKREEPRKLTLKVDFSEYFENEKLIEENDKISFMQKYCSYIYTPVNNRNYLKNNITFLFNEGNIGIYEVLVSDLENNIAYLSAKYIGYNTVNSFLIARCPYFVQSDTNNIGKVIFDDNGYTILGYAEKITEEQDIYEVKLRYNCEDTYITKKVKWTDKEKGIATLNLGYVENIAGAIQVSLSNCVSKIYIDKLSDEFDLSPEYYNDSSWKILDTVDYDNLLEMKWYFGGSFAKVPMEVFNEFYSVDDKSYKNVKFVYVKDTKTIYWCSEVSNKENNVNVNIVYNKYGKKSDEKVVDTNKEAMLFDYYGYYYVNEIYNIATPSLKYVNTQEGIIKISKLVEEKEKNTYYVGIFENEKDSNTNKIYEIETENGKGDIVIEIPEYDENKEYYIYEVDKEGNKVTDELIKYNQNKMEFMCIRDAKIESDKSVVSSVMSDRYEKYDRNNVDKSKWHEIIYSAPYSAYYFETDARNSKGTGEEDYIDNVLNVHNIYQANVIISYDKVKYKVEYVSEDGGTLEGEKEEIVAEGEKVQNVPTPKSDKGYKFVRFEVEENGERVEVNPAEYVITKDTVFYAIFEPEEVMGLPNTSDINIWMYIGIFVIAIIVMIIVLLIIHKNKRSKK